MTDAVRAYKEAMATLLLRRELESIALADEKPYTDILESEWERMTTEEQAGVDIWVREMHDSQKEEAT